MTNAAAIAPERPLEQRMAALERANEIRSWRAGVKRELAAVPKDESRDRIVELIMDPPARLRSMRMLDLLLACRTVGRVKANRILMRAHCSPSKTVGGLTDRQRQSLAWSLNS